MPLLYFFEQMRNPVLDAVMLFFTHLGEETLFMAVAMFFLWCVDKYEGYYLLSIGFLGTQLNQLLKVLFRVPRPWVRDPRFQPVQAAVKGATGYSFPSGHTQGAVGTFGGLFRWNKGKGLRFFCGVLCVMVPLSRMYLGVHTPWDVGVSVLLALVLVLVLYPLMRTLSLHPERMRWLFWGMLLWSVGQVLFMEWYPFPVDADSAELQSALKNAYTMVGAVLGFAAAYELDQRWIHYETKAAFGAQLAKWLLGLLLAIGVKEGVFWCLSFLPGKEEFWKGVSYCLMVLFAGAVWPLSFPWFQKWNK